MLFGCPKCRHAKTCMAHLELDQLLMKHSEHFQAKHCMMIYESFGVACKNFAVEKRSRNDEPQQMRRGKI